METKDIVYIIGISVTFIIGLGNIIYSFISHKRTLFINSVTSERVKWIGQLRENISSFCGLTYHWKLTNIQNEEEVNKILQEIDKLRMLIKLQLNPNGKYDNAIIDLIDKIPDLTGYPIDKLKQAIDELLKITQSLLKEEWDRVKEESKGKIR